MRQTSYFKTIIFLGARITACQVTLHLLNINHHPSYAALVKLIRTGMVRSDQYVFVISIIAYL